MAKNVNAAGQIVIDEKMGLIFDNEDQLYKHFSSQIKQLEQEHNKLRSADDFSNSEATQFESQLHQTLEAPDEIWKDESAFPDMPLYIYIKEFEPPDAEDEGMFHVALTYRTGEIPSFVFLHFPSKDLSLVERYQRDTLIFDQIMRDAPQGAIEGDALLEGEDYALGLYEAMLKLRTPTDIVEERFREFSHLREGTIEEADEIWRSTDSFGNVLVTFIKDHSEESGDELYYVVVTLEDAPSNTHALLFSFPTTDKSLVERYQHGENLHAEDVVQESSH